MKIYISCRVSGTQDPLPLATRMKTYLTIATVAYRQDIVVGFNDALTKIASPGYNFTNFNGNNVVSELKTTMIQVNCYCPNEWFQMRSSSKYGVCIRPFATMATRTAARLSCRNQWNNAYMLNEFTQMKHDFVLRECLSLSVQIKVFSPEVIGNITTFTQPYYIGLSYSNGNWQWDQPNGQPLIPVG